MGASSFYTCLIIHIKPMMACPLCNKNLPYCLLRINQWCAGRPVFVLVTVQIHHNHFCLYYILQFCICSKNIKERLCGWVVCRDRTWMCTGCDTCFVLAWTISTCVTAAGDRCLTSFPALKILLHTLHVILVGSALAVKCCQMSLIWVLWLKEQYE